MSTLLMLLTLVLIVIASTALPEPAALRPGDPTMKRARRPARSPSPPSRCRRAAKDKLHLYNWNNYIAPETVKRFEDAVQVRGRADLLLGQRGAARQARRRRQGLRRARADRQRRAGADQGRPAEAARQGAAAEPQERRSRATSNTPFDPGNKYSVPYAMSTTIIGYNDEKMKELGLPTDTWAVIFDPKYLEKVKGRVTVLDSAERAVRRGAQVPRLLGQRRRREALGGGRRRRSRRRSRTGRRSTPRRTSRS